MTEVWVFNGINHFPSGIFSSREKAEQWIAKHQLSGCLTKYPMDIGIYEWAIANGAFKPKRPEHSQPKFIGRFSSASLEHYHYEDGQIPVSEPSKETIEGL
jgi:hypothetical protein